MSENKVIANTESISKNIFDLTGKSAIVTGAGQGMGEQIARTLAMFGADVAIADINLEAAEKSADKIKKEFGHQTVAIQVDVSNYEQAESMVQQAIDGLGKVDTLINNAGILGIESFEDITPEQWSKLMSINLDGVFYCSKAVTRHMVSRKTGNIITLGSSWSSRSSVFNYSGGGPDYNASKAAVQSLTRSIAQDLAPHGIRANAVAPGIVDTPMHTGRKAEIEAFIGNIPLGRLQLAEDIVGSIVFLAAEASRYITGQTLHVNGGLLMID